MPTKNMGFNSATILKVDRITMKQIKKKNKATSEKAAGDKLKSKNEANAAYEFFKK